MIHPCEKLGKLVSIHDDGTATVLCDGEEQIVYQSRISYEPPVSVVYERAAKLQEVAKQKLLDPLRHICPACQCPTIVLIGGKCEDCCRLEAYGLPVIVERGEEWDEDGP